MLHSHYSHNFFFKLLIQIVVKIELEIILGYKFDGMIGKTVEDRGEENRDQSAN